MITLDLAAFVPFLYFLSDFWTDVGVADYAAVHAQCRNLLGNELTRKLAANTRSQSSQLAEPLWTDPGLKSAIGVRKLISTFFFFYCACGNSRM